jgi:hypothetical protein
MAILSSELVPYCSVNMPQDESSTVGGAIDGTFES